MFSEEKAMPGDQPNPQGAKRQHFIDFEQLGKHTFNNNLTSADGQVVKGDTMFVGMITKKRGSGSQPHTHPFEQFNYVVKGALRACVDGEERLVLPGGLIHIPANTVHTTVAGTDEDCMYLMIKEATPMGTSGIPQDPTLKGPRYEAGFEPK
jgi:quercetin dioxygenase-like cupin family protein